MGAVLGVVALILSSYLVQKPDFRIKLLSSVLIPLLFILLLREALVGFGLAASTVLLSIGFVYSLRTLSVNNLDRWVAYAFVVNLSTALALPVSVDYFPLLSLSYLPILGVVSGVALKYLRSRFGTTNLIVLRGMLSETPVLGYLTFVVMLVMGMAPFSLLFFPSVVSLYLSFSLDFVGIYRGLVFALTWFLLGYGTVKVFNTFYGEVRGDLKVKDLQFTEALTLGVSIAVSLFIGVLFFAKYLSEAVP